MGTEGIFLREKGEKGDVEKGDAFIYSEIRGQRTYGNVSDLKFLIKH